MDMLNGDGDRVHGLLRGAVGSLAGLAAMGLYFRASQTISKRMEARNGHHATAEEQWERWDRGREERRARAANGEEPASSEESQEEDGPIERIHALDDISVVGRQHEGDEPATEAVGRIGYETVTGGDEPDDATKQKLGQAVHWGYGILLGAAYGALRSEAESPDIAGGLGYGTAAWIIGDELMVPLLGLADGPTSHPWTDHAKALGAHLVYGAATSAATQALKRVM